MGWPSNLYSLRMRQCWGCVFLFPVKASGDGWGSYVGNTRSEEKNTIIHYILRLNMEYPRAYKWNIIEYPQKYDIIFHLGLPQEYPYSYSPRRMGIRFRGTWPGSGSVPWTYMLNTRNAEKKKTPYTGGGRFFFPRCNLWSSVHC